MNNADSLLSDASRWALVQCSGNPWAGVAHVVRHLLGQWRKKPHTPAVSLSPSKTTVVGFTCTYTQSSSRTVQQSQLSPAFCLSGHDILRNFHVFEGGDTLEGGVCSSVRQLEPVSGILTDISTKPRKEDWNAIWEVLSSQPVTGPVGWGGNWPLGDHTQLPIHSGQRLYILNSCCLCLAFNLAALTQLPETSLQGTTVTLAFQSYLTCTHPPTILLPHILYDFISFLRQVYLRKCIVDLPPWFYSGVLKDLFQKLIT